jgi:selT/selW/selH-like putative selenoprotein
LAAELKKRVSGLTVELIKSSGGAFEIRRDDVLIFSKLQEGRFPETEEILKTLSKK